MRLFVAALVVLTTQGEPMPPAFGTLVSKLTAHDHREINRLATRMGGSVWVILGDTGWLSSTVWSVEVHKKSSDVAAGVRFGEVVWLAADLKPDQSARTWRIDAVGLSAQVPLAGRDPDEVTSDMDANRPFRVHGQWSADELGSLVAFIRSSPRSTNPKVGIAQVNGALPIWAAWRNADETVQVGMRVRAREIHRVDLVRQGQAWVVLSIRLAVAD